MSNDISLCSDVQEYEICNNCNRNPKNTTPDEYWQSYIDPVLDEESLCLTYWKIKDKKK